jgi:hypothetical protein
MPTKANPWVKPHIGKSNMNLFSTILNAHITSWWLATCRNTIVKMLLRNAARNNAARKLIKTDQKCIYMSIYDICSNKF